MKWRLHYFHWLGIIEGFSLLVLLFIAMPMKWFFNQPEMVRQMGSIHGILFLMFAHTLVTLAIELKWSRRKILSGLFAASFPFGWLWFAKKFKYVI